MPLSTPIEAVINVQQQGVTFAVAKHGRSVSCFLRLRALVKVKIKKPDSLCELFESCATLPGCAWHHWQQAALTREGRCSVLPVAPKTIQQHNQNKKLEFNCTRWQSQGADCRYSRS